MAASFAKDVCLLVICLLKIKAPNKEDYLWHDFLSLLEN
jgi:hypothetical protein